MSQTMLEGVRIIDMTTMIFGPYCTQMLADLGADVIKVEAPAGDLMRIAGNPAKTPGMGPAFVTTNRGKRSVVLDLKQEQGRRALAALLGDADVFIHNVRADAIARLGFDYASVKALRPDIIYAHCVGFGSGGPYAGLQAYDDVIQAASGMTDLVGRYDGDGRPRYVPSVIADKVGALYASQAVLAAVVHRLRSGEGQQVEIPMFETFTQFLFQEHLFGQTFQPPTSEEAGYFRQLDPHRNPFPTADGHISIVPHNDHCWLTLLDLLGCPELTERPEFSGQPERRANISLLYKEMAQRTPQKTTAEWMTLCRTASIPAMPVCPFDRVLEDQHLWATGLFQRRRHPSEGDYVEMPLPTRFSARAPRPARPAPHLGQHTDEVLAEYKITEPPR
ncbi:CAIB/BAIF CoA-transferase, family III [Alloalcanivorax dieselolei B5]|uniref:CAIB/BAIF CoA-transferase, family III n=1 Tax=Alcanivorax dieselolei (strain DSM 16502 / CGMCC 1.3690 / MCCC 1A00001 / B-5) TaxID=930169 RepID=K0CBW2_ALCDB|nr:CoA transferase [Alloalcanivorax dieselolei]AFT68981.1 CAIB/BAIF CoA-transferase, family III [Alloalcanivorax dieselolei B5]GGJ81624.1 CoA transferase [Alloalcanivorax dieselolei]